MNDLNKEYIKLSGISLDSTLKSAEVQISNQLEKLSWPDNIKSEFKKEFLLSIRANWETLVSQIERLIFEYLTDDQLKEIITLMKEKSALMNNHFKFQSQISYILLKFGTSMGADIQSKVFAKHNFEG